jgi:tRNA(adenine34) deaminase
MTAEAPLTAEDRRWMEVALAEARAAAEDGEVPVGAVVVRRDQVLARGRNRVESLRDPSAHAEMAAIRTACSATGYQRLPGCTLYVTLEPCAMCAGAIVLARLDRLVFGAVDPKAGACGSLMNLVQDGRLNHRLPVSPGVSAEECGGLLRAFFERIRGPQGSA